MMIEHSLVFPLVLVFVPMTMVVLAMLVVDRRHQRSRGCRLGVSARSEAAIRPRSVTSTSGRPGRP